MNLVPPHTPIWPSTHRQGTPGQRSVSSHGVADCGAEHGLPFVLGHALSMKAIHGGKANNDKLDAQKIAVRLRGGMLPQADVYPADLHATRDLLRRRMHLARQRGEFLAPGQHTNRPYNLPAIVAILILATRGEEHAQHSLSKGIASKLPLSKSPDMRDFLLSVCKISIATWQADTRVSPGCKVGHVGTNCRKHLDLDATHSRRKPLFF